jgi:hypothetical protein
VPRSAWHIAACASASPGTVGGDDRTHRGARIRSARWNIGLTVVHSAQAALILVVSRDFSIAVTTAPPQGPPGTRLPDAETLVEVPIGPANSRFTACTEPPG